MQTGYASLTQDIIPPSESKLSAIDLFRFAAHRLRRRDVRKYTVNMSETTNDTPTRIDRCCRCPTQFIREASKLCQDDEPRWRNNGVSTNPFSMCRRGELVIPPRIRREERFSWRVKMVLKTRKSERCCPSQCKINLRCVVTASTEHDRDVWKVEPHMVIWSEVVDEIPHKLVTLAGHHEADRKASRMSGWSDKFEASQRS